MELNLYVMNDATQNMKSFTQTEDDILIMCLIEKNILCRKSVKYVSILFK